MANSDTNLLLYVVSACIHEFRGRSEACFTPCKEIIFDKFLLIK